MSTLQRRAPAWLAFVIWALIIAALTFSAMASLIMGGPQ